MTMYTYEFNAFTEASLLEAGSGNGSNLGNGDSFDMPATSDAVFVVTDNDHYLSGDGRKRSNDIAKDGSFQTAEIYVDGEEAGNGGRIYGEKYFWVLGSSDQWYMMIEIEQEGISGDYFTFYNAYGVPEEGETLTVSCSGNINCWQPHMGCLEGAPATTPPVALLDSITISEGEAIGDSGDDAQLNILENDFDADGEINLIGVNGAEPGSVITVTTEGGVTIDVTVDANGNLFFDAGSDFDGLRSGESDSFELTYTIIDNGGSESSSTVTVTIEGETEIDAVGDFITVSETEGAGDLEVLDSGESSILANDTLEGQPYDGLVVTVNGQSGNVGAWIDLEKGRVKVNADGTIDFDAEGDFSDLNDGDSESVTLNYTIADGVIAPPNPDDGVDICAFKYDNDGGKPVEIVLTYSFADGFDQVNAQDSDKRELSTLGSDDDGTVFIQIFDKDEENVIWEGSVGEGESFAVTNGGDKFDSETHIKIFDFEGGALLQDIEFHTSCSQPLAINDRFGSITLNGTQLEGGRQVGLALTEIGGGAAGATAVDAATVTIVIEGETDGDEFCLLENTNDPVSTSIIVDCPEFDETPQDLCMFKSAGDKPATLQMLYNFGTGIEQVVDGDKHEILTAATQPDGGAWDEVYIVVKDKNGVVQFSGDVARGETFEISGTKDDGSFESETYFEIYDFQGGALLQEMNVHTSCSDPTNTTDRFGSVTLTGATLQSGAVVSGYTNTQYSGDALSYTLLGPDAHLFEVDAKGDVSFINAPDFENPLDVGADNEYIVVVRGTIPGTDKFEDQTLLICVKDDDDVTTISGRVFRDTNEDGLEAEYTTVTTPQPDEVRDIAIVNRSFESDSLKDDHYNSSITGWSTNKPGYTGEWDPTDGDFMSGPTCGENVAWIEGAGTNISQTLAETYNDNATYTFTIDIGDSSYDNNEDFTVRLLAGSTVIDAVSGNTGVGNDFETVTLSSANFSSTSVDGQALTIEITNDSGSWIYVDNVLGTVTTPQPDLVTVVETLEPAFEGAIVRLLDASGDPVMADGVPITTMSDADGNYSFEAMPAGDYRVQVVEPQNWDFTAQNVGSDDAIDSDVDAATGASDVISILDGQLITNVDVGLLFNPSIPPVAVDDVINTDEDTAVTGINIITAVDGNVDPNSNLGEDSDPDGPTSALTITKVIVDGADVVVPDGGSAVFTATDTLGRSVEVTVDGAGNVTVGTPEGFDATDDQDGMFTFEYEITDEDGEVDVAQVTINVDDLAEPIAPVAVDDVITTDEDTAVDGLNIITGVDGNDLPTSTLGADSDPDGSADDLTITQITVGSQVIAVPTTGTTTFTVDNVAGQSVDVTIDNQGNISVAKPDGFDATDDQDGVFSFEYTIVDSDGLEDEATVTINVEDLDEPAAGPEINVVFLLDASDSAVSANTGILDVGDLNGDFLANSHFDVSISVMQDAINNISQALGGNPATQDVDIGVFSFESQLPGDAGTVEAAVALTDGTETVFDLSTDFGGIISDMAANGGTPFGDNGSLVVDGGVAFMAAAMDAANGFISNNAASGDAINLVYVLTASTGMDIGNDYFANGIPGQQDGVADGFLPVDFLEGLPGAGPLIADLNLEDTALTKELLEAQTLGLSIDTLFFQDSAVATNQGLFALENFSPDANGVTLADNNINQGSAGKDAFLANITTLVDDLIA